MNLEVNNKKKLFKRRSFDFNNNRNEKKGNGVKNFGFLFESVL